MPSACRVAGLRIPIRELAHSWVVVPFLAMSKMTVDTEVREAMPREKVRFALARMALLGGFLALVLPGFVYPYLYDDFDFLVRTLHFSPSLVLPDPGTLFYRPISRELYFALLQWLSPGGPALGHGLNAAILLAACLLTVRIGAQHLGSRGGVLAGVLVVGSGQLPMLVSWVSGAQDAIAIGFTLLALLLETRGRHVSALVAAGCAVLSKETAVAALPAIAFAAHTLSLTERRSRSRALDYLILVIFWAALHPGVHLLVQRGFRVGGTEYVGWDGHVWHQALVRYIPLFANLPPFGSSADWPHGLTSVAAIAAALTVTAIAVAPRHAVAPISGKMAPFLFTAALLAGGPLLLVSVLLQQWAPYYVVFPAIGVAWILAAWLRRASTALLIVLVLLYVLGGVRLRGMVVDPGVPTERNMARAASALNRLEPQFRALAPTVAPGTQVLVANQVQGSASVHAHLFTFQALRQWYREPTIRVTRPERRLPGGAPELLFWVNRDLHVFQINLTTLQPRSVKERASFFEYQGVLRAYTRGLAESNEVDRAVDILLSMPQRRAEYRWWDRRLAASYLLAFGRRSEARLLLVGAPPIDRDLAVGVVVELLAQPTRVARYDTPTMEAFNLDHRSPTDIADVMERLAETRNPAAPRFARHLLELQPRDPRAIQVLRAFEQLSPTERITPAQPPA